MKFYLLQPDLAPHILNGLQLRDSSSVCPQINGHKEEILCVVQCPPSLLATSSFDGEIVVWNLLSGHTQCRFAAEHQNAEGDFGTSKWIINIFNSHGFIVWWDQKPSFISFFPSSSSNSGLDVSVPSIIFLKNSKMRRLSLTTALLSSGVKGRGHEKITITLWITVCGCNLRSLRCLS